MAPPFSAVLPMKVQVVTSPVEFVCGRKQSIISALGVCEKALASAGSEGHNAPLHGGYLLHVFREGAAFAGDLLV